MDELEQMDLVSIRNLFLQEMREYLAVIDTETPEELSVRKARIRKIDRVLEEKKKNANQKNLDLV
ncbi:MAG TPA: hypothetical protein VFR58_03530 [Flavisolibacter sp.]|nr:hypothetical protein [Flavisolibacter sp.]